MGLPSDPGWVVWYVEVATSSFAQIAALFLLIMKKKKKTSHLLLVQLFLLELLYIIWKLIFHFVEHLHWIPSTIERVCLFGEMFIGYSLCLVIIWVTTDRILAVKLGLRYTRFATKRKLLALTMFTVLAAIVHCLIAWYAPLKITSTLMVTWDALVVIYLFSAYVYIIVAVHQRRRDLNHSNSRCQYRRFKYEVPLIIGWSFALLVELPNLLSHVTENYSSSWLYVVWFLNFNIDPITYLFYSKGYCRLIPCCQVVARGNTKELKHLNCAEQKANVNDDL